MWEKTVTVRWGRLENTVTFGVPETYDPDVGLDSDLLVDGTVALAGTNQMAIGAGSILASQLVELRLTNAVAGAKAESAVTSSPGYVVIGWFNGTIGGAGQAAASWLFTQAPAARVSALTDGLWTLTPVDVSTGVILPAVRQNGFVGVLRFRLVREPRTPLPRVPKPMSSTKTYYFYAADRVQTSSSDVSAQSFDLKDVPLYEGPLRVHASVMFAGNGTSGVGGAGVGPRTGYLYGFEQTNNTIIYNAAMTLALPDASTGTGIPTGAGGVLSGAPLVVAVLSGMRQPQIDPYGGGVAAAGFNSLGSGAGFHAAEPISYIVSRLPRQLTLAISASAATLVTSVVGSVLCLTVAPYDSREGVSAFSH